jgi:coenzyme Q-binding protein COQ10
MPQHAEQRFLAHTPEQVFAVIADVAKYPEFLPWCLGARISRQYEDGFEADLIIGFKMFRESFTSRVTLEAPEKVHVEYIRGPMRRLSNDWHLSPHTNAAGESGTLVDFAVDFEFKSSILEKLIGALFEEAVHHMVSAFMKRADKIYS